MTHATTTTSLHELSYMYIILHTVAHKLYDIGVEAALGNVKGYDFNACKGHANNVVKRAKELKAYLLLHSFTTNEQALQGESLSTLLLKLHKLLAHMVIDEADVLDTSVTRWLRGLQDYLGTLAHFEAASAGYHD